MFIRPDTYTGVSPATFTSAIQLRSNFATVELADAANDFLFTFDVPDEGNASFTPRRRPIRVSGFFAKGNSANNDSCGFLNFAGAGSDAEIHNNTLDDFLGATSNSKSAAGILVGSGGDAHTAFIHSNAATDMADWFVRLDSGWNWVIGNDAGGGVKSTVIGTNFIQSNSIFDSSTDGAQLSHGDIFSGNVCTDNVGHGMQLYKVENVTVTGNLFYDNSRGADGQSAGILVSGTSTSPVRDCLIQNNRSSHLDINRGVQGYGIWLTGHVERTRIDHNNFRGNSNGAVHVTNKNFTDVRATGNFGYQTYNHGAATQSADGTATTFTFKHFLDDTPSGFTAQPASTDAMGDFIVERTPSEIRVVYATAPPSGTDNLKWRWSADARFV